MKNLFVLAACMLLSILPANAQVENSIENIEATNTTTEAVVNDTQSTSLLPPPAIMLTQSVFATNDYTEDSSYKSAKGLRTAGQIITGVGGAATLVFGIVAIAGTSSDEVGGWLVGGSAIIPAAVSAVVTGIGAIMWGSAQHKMNKIKAASNGVGLAFQF